MVNISQLQINHFNEYGFLKIEGFYSIEKDINPIRVAISRIIDLVAKRHNIDLANKAKHITSTAKVSHEWRYIHDQVGYNYRMPNLNAALGCAQLKKLDDFCKSKRKLFFKYKDAFRNLNGITLFEEPPFSRSNYWLQTLILDRGLENELEKILEYTNNNGIMTRPAWDLLPNLKMFKECPKAPLPIAHSLSNRIINIPSSAYLV